VGAIAAYLQRGIGCLPYAGVFIVPGSVPCTKDILASDYTVISLSVNLLILEIKIISFECYHHSLPS
jgi:hypothetical protein